MNRLDLEHLIRAAGAIIQRDELIIIGSQSILGAFPDIDNEVIIQSSEADIIPIGDEEDLRDVIDGSLGESSRFHKTFGIYAQGVALNTAVLPTGWRSRLIPVGGENTRGVTGWCLDPADLVLAKYAASREKDFEFNREVIREGLVSKDILLDRLSTMTIVPERKRSIQRTIEYEFSRKELANRIDNSKERS